MKNLIYKYCFIFATLIAAILPTSCIDDPESEITGKGQNRFRPVADDGRSLAVFDAQPGTYALVDVWRDVVSSSELKKGATVEFEVDNSILAEYNANNPPTEPDFVEAPSSAVSLMGTTLTYEPDDFTKSIMVTLNPENLNLSARNALGIRLKNPSAGYGISGLAANGEFIAEVIVKNKYAGSYSYTGHIGRYDASCSLIELGGNVQPGVSVDLVTTGANSVSTQLLWATGSIIGGIGSSQTINIDPATNVVTLVANGASPANWGPIEGQPNYYDPETGDIYISWRWSAPCATAEHGYIRHVRVKLIKK